MQVPVTVLTGYLGSGKTTLLNGLLRGDHGQKIAVIINELGSIGIDGKVVSGGETFVELDNGCLCCALNADLDKTLQELAARGGFSHLVIETTGAADPLPIGWMFSRPHLSPHFRLDAIVTTVDAVNVQRAATLGPEVLQQIIRADLVVLTKLDLVSDGGVAARDFVRQHNRLAPIVEATDGSLPWDLLLEGKPLPRQGGVATHSHGPALDSVAFQSPRGLTEAGLEALLDEVPLDVFRIKGLVRTTDTEWAWMLVNGVGGRLDLVPSQPSRPPEASTLVFIGKQLDREALLELCAVHFR